MVLDSNINNNNNIAREMKERYLDLVDLDVLVGRLHLLGSNLHGVHL